MNYTDEKFEVGQVWNYETRKGEENSTIQIVKIDKLENEEVFIHISVNGLRMKNSSTESKLSETIGHLPFSRKSIVESVTTLKSSKEELSDFEAGYQNWKEAFEAKKAGVFTISIAEAVKFVETTMNQ
ncbi:hypothetical protein WAF17_14905 [Bernardetia sp. ABR2-2B]|uniref:hypothetical protein n=1 Tax=Bernardetia sp. ABR2-2B TaxID=3127472 RepID=UPI0030CCFB11